MKVRRLSPAELDELAAQAAPQAGAVRFRAELWGTSMAPMIRHGDCVVVETAPLAELTPGEVVVYRNAGRLLVAHRLLEVVPGPDGPEALMQAQDPASVVDRVPAASVLGRVVAVERAGPFIRWARRLARLGRRILSSIRQKKSAGVFSA